MLRDESTMMQRLYITGAEKNLVSRMMVDYSIGNVDMVTDKKMNTRISTCTRQKAGIHDVVQWGRGPNGPFGRGSHDRVEEHEEVRRRCCPGCKEDNEGVLKRSART